MFYIRVLDSYTLVTFLFIRLFCLQIFSLLWNLDYFFFLLLQCLFYDFVSPPSRQLSFQPRTLSQSLFFPYITLSASCSFFHSCLIFLLLIVGNEGLLMFLKVMLGCFFPLKNYFLLNAEIFFFFYVTELFLLMVTGLFILKYSLLRAYISTHLHVYDS